VKDPYHAHWRGFFLAFQVYRDMADIYDYRLKNGKIKKLFTVMSPALSKPIYLPPSGNLIILGLPLPRDFFFLDITGMHHICFCPIANSALKIKKHKGPSRNDR
jgi:hypothetical protein